MRVVIRVEIVDYIAEDLRVWVIQWHGSISADEKRVQNGLRHQTYKLPAASSTLDWRRIEVQTIEALIGGGPGSRSAQAKLVSHAEVHHASREPRKSR